MSHTAAAEVAADFGEYDDLPPHVTDGLLRPHVLRSATDAEVADALDTDEATAARLRSEFWQARGGADERREVILRVESVERDARDALDRGGDPAPLLAVLASCAAVRVQLLGLAP